MFNKLAVTGSLLLSMTVFAQRGFDSIVSMQQWDVGIYHVICEDGSKVVVEKAEILADQACKVAPVVLESGTFTSQTLACPHTVVP